jgi:hypothetical protein
LLLTCGALLIVAKLDQLCFYLCHSICDLGHSISAHVSA